MDTALRELLDRSKFCRASVEQVAALLPTTDEALSDAIAETTAVGDQLGFITLVTAALDAGRRVGAEHLVRGAVLTGAVWRLGNFAWKMDGDVPAALMAALRGPAMAREMEAGLLFVVGVWCAEWRDGEVPPELAPRARVLARVKGLPLPVVAHLAGLADILGDEGLLAVLRECFPHAMHQAMEQKTKDVVQATRNLFLLRPLDLVPAVASRNLSHHRPMRRAVEKLGRNDLCHCASGKKYKQCCMVADQERLRFSTEVEGHTHADLRAAPEAGLTDSRLQSLAPFELAQIVPAKVPEILRGRYLMHITGMQLFERVAEYFETVEWSEERKEEWDFAIFFVMRAQQQEIARRMVAVRTRHDPGCKVDECVRLLLARDEPAEELRTLAETATMILSETEPEELTKLAYGILCSRHAELGILVCRSLIPMLPPKDASFFLDQILETRDKLNLPPAEPFSDVLEKRLAEETHDEGADAAALRDARRRLDAKAAEIRQLHEEIERQRRALDRKEKAPPPADRPAAPTLPGDDAERQALRVKLNQLKATLHERAAERITLRRELERAREELEILRQGQTALAATTGPSSDDESTHYLPEQPAGNQPVRLIEFPPKFRTLLEDLPRQTARSTLSLLGRLAGGESAAFAGVVPLKACPGILRQRVGSDYRLLFRLLPDCVRVVDLINRRDLDRKIKSLQAAG